MVIVGAGIVGVSTAYFLKRAGVPVRLVDARAPAAAATGAADGAVSVASKRPGPMMATATAGIRLYRELTAEGVLDGLFFTRSTFLVAVDDAEAEVLATHAASYATIPAPAGSKTLIRVGTTEIPAPSLHGLPPAQAKATEQAFRVATGKALSIAGYPAIADPEDVNQPMILILLIVLMAYGAMTLGPIAAILVEMFPTRIRYSAMSLPYHIGNGYFGGLLPTVCFALVAQRGDIYFGLWYPVVVAGVSGVIGLLFIKEPTRDQMYGND